MLNDGRDSAMDQADPRERPAHPRPAREDGGDGAGQAPRAAASGPGPNGHGICPSAAADGPAEDLLESIARAVLSPDRAEGEREMRALLDAGVDRGTIIDAFIPAVARRFGEGWLNSGHSFAEVTIAVSRLQAWLRDLDGPLDDDPFRLDAPEILLIVPEGCHHTLGAMVAMSRFRRLGALVKLSLGQDARAIGTLVRRQRFDMVAVSAAGNEDLEFLYAILNGIRSGFDCPPPVVLGGPILEHNRDAAALIGADHASSDPEEALSLCGLTISRDAGRAERMATTSAGRHPDLVPNGP
ncbi:MAG: hypothetical protein V2I65_08315 [Paracoccaceae bacterium]|jgi:hypothetical protein|nr:hypothetical protein [Paracoccaceae bacterium]